MSKKCYRGLILTVFKTFQPFDFLKKQVSWHLWRFFLKTELRSRTIFGRLSRVWVLWGQICSQQIIRQHLSGQKYALESVFMCIAVSLIVNSSILTFSINFNWRKVLKKIKNLGKNSIVDLLFFLIIWRDKLLVMVLCV